MLSRKKKIDEALNKNYLGGVKMKLVLANCSASISELKRNPSALIEQSDGEPIAILNHNKPTAYLIPTETYEELL